MKTLLKPYGGGIEQELLPCIVYLHILSLPLVNT